MVKPAAIFRFVLLSTALLLARMTAAKADYFFQFAQFDETGTELERGSWRCTDAEMEFEQCTQGILLIVRGRPNPVDLRFKYTDRLRITASIGHSLLSMRSSKGEFFSRKGILATTLILSMTDESIEPNKRLLQNPVLRNPGYTPFATLSLLVRRLGGSSG